MTQTIKELLEEEYLRLQVHDQPLQQQKEPVSGALYCHPGKRI